MSDNYLLSFDEIYNSYVYQQSLIETQLRLLSKGDYSSVSIPSHLIGEQVNVIREYYLELLKELNHAYSFNSIALTEAKLRLDFITRARTRKKDNLSRYFREIYAEQGSSISLDDNIIDAWKRHYIESKSLFSKFKSLLQYRHWIAHGRAWAPKWGRMHDFIEVFFICNSINQTISKKYFA